MVEKASYTGPWQVPWKRAKKDPSAPKRPMSAFLYYSQGKRALLKKQHPEMKNTEVSRLLGEMWRNAAEGEKRPHIEKEKEEREKYKVAIAKWRKEAEEKQKAQQKAQSEWVEQAVSAAAHAPAAAHPNPSYGDPYAVHPHAPPHHHHPAGHYYQHPHMPYGAYDVKFLHSENLNRMLMTILTPLLLLCQQVILLLDHMDTNILHPLDLPVKTSNLLFWAPTAFLNSIPTTLRLRSLICRMTTRHPRTLRKRILLSMTDSMRWSKQRLVVLFVFILLF